MLLVRIKPQDYEYCLSTTNIWSGAGGCQVGSEYERQNKNREKKKWR